MRVIITRTSAWEEKPCKEAKKITVPYWHIRTCSEEYFNNHFAANEGLWESKGKNHKTFKASGGLTKMWIARQEDDKECWGVEINSLEDLLKLKEKYGKLILSDYDSVDPCSRETISTVEIYDSYRE